MNPSKLKMPFSPNSLANTGFEGDGGGGETVIFGPLEIPREELLQELLWLHNLTRAEDIETALSLCWHKVTDKAGREKMSRLVHLYRVSQDGKSRPPFDFADEYARISGHEPVPTLTLTR